MKKEQKNIIKKTDDLLQILADNLCDECGSYKKHIKHKCYCEKCGISYLDI